MDGERLSGSGSASHAKGSRVINVHAKIVGGRVIATVNVEIGTGRFTYTVQFADQGNDAEMRPRRNVNCATLLRKFLSFSVHREGAHWCTLAFLIRWP